MLGAKKILIVQPGAERQHNSCYTPNMGYRAARKTTVSAALELVKMVPSAFVTTRTHLRGSYKKNGAFLLQLVCVLLVKSHRGMEGSNGGKRAVPQAAAPVHTQAWVCCKAVCLAVEDGANWTGRVVQTPRKPFFV